MNSDLTAYRELTNQTTTLISFFCTCSAILYLNEDFEGGEFVFATDLTAKNIQVCLT